MSDWSSDVAARAPKDSSRSLPTSTVACGAERGSRAPSECQRPQRVRTPVRLRDAHARLDHRYPWAGVDRRGSRPVIGTGLRAVPSVELRRNVAERVLSALSLRGWDALIDGTNSKRYHEVGFVISLSGHQSAQGVILNVGTKSLQRITDDLGLARLKLSVCGTDADAFSTLGITASQPGRHPLAVSQERGACEVWDVKPDQSPVEITVRSRSLTSTGFGAPRLVVVSTALLLLGLVAIAAGRLARASRRRAF